MQSDDGTPEAQSTFVLSTSSNLAFQMPEMQNRKEHWQNPKGLQRSVGWDNRVYTDYALE